MGHDVGNPLGVTKIENYTGSYDERKQYSAPVSHLPGSRDAVIIGFHQPHDDKGDCIVFDLHDPDGLPSPCLASRGWELRESEKSGSRCEYLGGSHEDRKPYAPTDYSHRVLPARGRSLAKVRRGGHDVSTPGGVYGLRSS